MAMFDFEAMTADGRLVKGQIEAQTPAEAQAMVLGMGLTAESVTKAPRPPRVATALGKTEFLLFNEQLASLARSGVPLDRGLREVASDVASPRLRRVINEIAADLESGTSIEQAFASWQGHFPPLYGEILRAGVRSGRLADMLTSLNRHLEMAGQTRRILVESLAYPVTVLLLASVIVTAMFTFLVPQFKHIWQGYEANLPTLTRILFAMADGVPGFWMTTGIIVVALASLHLALSRIPQGRRAQESFGLRLPMLGRVYRYGTLARLADAMALLIGAGCDMPASLRMAGAACGNELAIQECNRLAQQVEQGQSLDPPAQAGRLIPGFFLYSMQSGIRRNELADNLYNLSEMYAAQARAGQTGLQALLLPLATVFIGLIIGFFVVACFMPLPAMVQSLRT